ncbi:ABC transporter substrate-binding protein [Rubrimonas sp.]|uniref:ABC transporter substrate-binding protein n=1 Tax=Rubrimonas sp. TaxID=2036015 RepID=UPI002FDE2C7E
MRRLLALVLALACGAAAAAPGRVVSMNLCTDQLAMLLAAPGQLVSVTRLARDRSTSMMATEAAAIQVNHGLAEEVFLMQPDLVVAGTFTTRATVGMLRRLGFEVVEFAPETSFDDVRANIRKMGAVLGREPQAEAMVATLDARLAAASLPTTGPQPRAALHYANSYTSGAGTLADAVVTAAGLANVAAERGVAGTARLPLEALVMADPDLIVSGRSYDPPALAQEVMAHPALRAVKGDAGEAVVSDARWICGTPFTVDAVAALAAAARGLAP